MQKLASECIVVTTTTATREEAEHIARQAVESRLAACVQCHAVRSTYRWQRKIEEADEFLLAFKTPAQLAAPLQELIAKLHSYDLPEIAITPFVGGSAAYLAWIHAETGVEETGSA